MTDDANSNITQVLGSFDKFVKILEDPNWTKSARAEDIKIAFKLGSFVEKTTEHFKSKNCFSEFKNILTKWWKTNDRTKVYSDDFYMFACDKLFARFFKSENMSESVLDIVVRVYSSLYPKERMQNVISELIITTASLEAISDFAKMNATDDDLKEIEYRLKLGNWAEMLQTARESIMKEEIMDILTEYKVESSLYIIIGILSLNNVSSLENQVQNIVLGSIQARMMDRSILSKKFWYTLFKKVNPSCFAGACVNFADFLISAFNFIVYLGSMMTQDGEIWKSDENISLCPEIGYRDLLIHIKSICELNSQMKNVVMARLNEAREFTNSSIWDQIIEEIN